MRFTGDTVESPEPCQHCHRGWGPPLAGRRLVCEWCRGRGIILIDRGYIIRETGEKEREEP